MANDTTTNPHSIGTATQTSSPFLELPPELRNRIYSAALTTTPNQLIEICAPYGLLQPSEQAPLTQTCRLIRAESLKLFYACNNFSISISGQHDEDCVRRWLHAIGPRNRSALQEVFIYEVGWAYYRVSVRSSSIARTRSRFLQRLEHSGTRDFGGSAYCVIKLNCLTFDD